MKKLFKYHFKTIQEVTCWDDVANYCADKHSIQSFQVTYHIAQHLEDSERLSEFKYYIDLTDKLGTVFATVGVINFNPKENGYIEQKSRI